MTEIVVIALYSPQRSSSCHLSDSVFVSVEDIPSSEVDSFNVLFSECARHLYSVSYSLYSNRSLILLEQVLYR